MEKKCTKCGEIKDISNFYKSKQRKDGYEGRCKDCCKSELTKYDLTCCYCLKQYKSSSKKSKYCSKKCESLNRIKRIEVFCSNCGKRLEITPSRKRENNFCDSTCQYSFISKNRRGENHHRYSKKLVNCSICNKELIRENGRVYDGRKYYCSNECKSIGNSKENSPKWNEQLTYNDRIVGRKFFDYELWRKLVFERDNYTCQCCSDDKGGNLVAHHILNYSEHKELRLDVNNGITFCKECHKEFHDNYGYKNNNKEQLNEFLSNKSKSA